MYIFYFILIILNVLLSGFADDSFWRWTHILLAIYFFTRMTAV